MRIAQLIAAAMKILEIARSDQVQKIIAEFKALIESLFGPKLAGYVAGRLEAKYAPESATFAACPCPDCDDEDCPCDADELAELEAVLDA